MSTTHERGRELEQLFGGFLSRHGYDLRCNVVIEGRSGARHELGSVSWSISTRMTQCTAPWLPSKAAPVHPSWFSATKRIDRYLSVVQARAEDG